MLTKIKRIRRNTGGEARKFENIPTASQPQQKDGIGTRNQFVDKFVTEQVKSPEVASSAQQQYTQQTVQSNELLSGSTMAAPTSVGATTISGSQITAPTAITSTQVTAPTSLKNTNRKIRPGKSRKIKEPNNNKVLNPPNMIKMSRASQK